MLYFFLSYARGDQDDDVLVQKFFGELSKEVRARAGLARDEEVGFVDTHSIEVGARWRSSLVSALSDCLSFVALCSPRYFVSQPCGKEWQAFTGRLTQYERITGSQAAALLPVLWLPQTRMHPIANEIQYDADVLGDAYRREGLRQLMRLARNQDAFIDFVSALAIRIVESAESHPVPRPRTTLDFEAIPSAFHAELIVAEAGVPAQNHATPANAQYVHFVVAAPTRRELVSVRSDRGYYGDSPHDWAPYQPSIPEPIADHAREVAARRSFDSGIADLDELTSRLHQAYRSNHIVVLLADAWITEVAEHRHTLEEFNDWADSTSLPTTAVMVPSSAADAETQSRWPVLSAALRDLLQRMADDDVMYRSAILTHHAFDADLEGVLEVARNRMFVNGPVYRRPAGDVGDRPILQGP